MQRRRRNGEPARVHPPTIVVEGAQLGNDVVGAFCFVVSGAVVDPGAKFTNMHHARAGTGALRTGTSRSSRTGPPLAPTRRWSPPFASASTRSSARGPSSPTTCPLTRVAVGNPARVVGWACRCGETLARTEKRPKGVKCKSCGRVLE